MHPRSAWWVIGRRGGAKRGTGGGLARTALGFCDACGVAGCRIALTSVALVAGG